MTDDLSCDAQAVNAWQRWDVAALDALCERMPSSTPAQRGEAAYWRALACLMCESADVLEHLERAHAAHIEAGELHRAHIDAHLALAVCVLDIGAMDQVETWHERARQASSLDKTHSHEPLGLLWLQLGQLARVALGAGDDARALAQAEAAAEALHQRLKPLDQTLLPNERLIAAQLLVNHHFHRQHYERFEWLAMHVEAPALFNQAAPLMQTRWCYTLGYALYQVGEHARAEESWQRALKVAEDHSLESAQLMTSLALVRLFVDAQRCDDADRILQTVQPRWGAGRTTQLIDLQQMRARVFLLRRQPVRAHGTLKEALALAETSGLSASEKASCLTDLSQVLIALDRGDEADQLLSQLADEHPGRNGEVFACLRDLHLALRLQHADAPASQGLLASGLAQAQRIRYTMFFRLLPEMAAQLCALALQTSIEPVFAAEVVRSRNLPAPEGAGLSWPWPLWVRMVGAFELQSSAATDDAAEGKSGKTQHKPLELLRFIACETGLAVGMQQAMDALWPEAEGDAARKSFEMAVQRLRRMLGDASLVTVGDGRVALDAHRVASDVTQRRNLIQRLEMLAMSPGRVDARQMATDLAARVLALTRGELLPGAAATPWLEAERRRLHQETVRASAAAATVLERTGSSSDEIALLKAALGVE